MGRYIHVGFTQIIQFVTSCFHQYFFTCQNWKKFRQSSTSSTSSGKFRHPFPPMYTCSTSMPVHKSELAYHFHWIKFKNSIPVTVCCTLESPVFCMTLQSVVLQVGPRLPSLETYLSRPTKNQITLYTVSLNLLPVR